VKTSEISQVREKDIESCRKLGVDVVFLPNKEDMYPAGYCTFVNVNGLSEVLCGASRPGHFCGVATVIVKIAEHYPAGRGLYGAEGCPTGNNRFQAGR